MSARNSDPCTPSRIFRAPRVAPTLESVSDSCDEFAARTAEAMGVKEEVLRARCDYNERVAEAAYFMAQRRGFEPGRELDDWIAAEVQVANAARHFQSPAKEPTAWRRRIGGQGWMPGVLRD